MYEGMKNQPILHTLNYCVKFGHVDTSGCRTVPDALFIRQRWGRR